MCDSPRDPRVLCGSGVHTGTVCPFTDNQPGISSGNNGKPHVPDDADREMAEAGVSPDIDVEQEEADEEAVVRVPKSPIRPSK